MKKEILHITNGSSLTTYLNDLDFTGEFLTWHEMLCEGPTAIDLTSKVFFDRRKQFFKTFYDLEIDKKKFQAEFSKLDSANELYSEIVLWFEYDLFCHINLIAILSLLNKLNVSIPISLVCSGWVKNETELKGLAQLTPESLLKHYKNRQLLGQDDLALGKTLWAIYNGKDHNLFSPYITKKSNFKYLSSCLKAHIRRFPDSKTGLNDLEYNILRLIKKHRITSEHQLLGYVLNYQGYYGFGDLQIKRILKLLTAFYETNDLGEIILTRNGHEALLGMHNFAQEINNSIYYGGVNTSNFMYNHNEKKLIKNPIHVN